MAKIVEADLLESCRQDSITYAIMVNRRRAVPDARDGLKLIHRRIVTACWCDNNLGKSRNENLTIKSAKIVGDVMGKYHPHGDSSIYGAFKPLANWFEINYPLILPQGNFGTFQGDPESAPRYTEVGLTKYCVKAIISDLKETELVVDWLRTYTDIVGDEEPEFLPVALPNLLINGAFGIGFGLKTEIPRHNLGEVIDETIKLIKNPNHQVVLVPEHSHKVEIFDTNFKAIANKGSGSYIARGIIEEIDYTGGRKALVIRSVPDMVFLNSCKEAITKLIELKKLPQIASMEEASSGDTMEYIIVLKKGTDPNFVKQLLYLDKTVQLQKKYNVSFEVLQGTEHVRMSYKSYLQSFIEFRKLTKFRLYCVKLQETETSLHRIEAYVKSLESGEIDEILKMIRSQTTINDKETVEYLIKKLKITDMQAYYIINAPNKSLSIGYLKKYQKDLLDLKAEREEYNSYILDDNKIEQLLISELLELKKEFNVPRRAVVIGAMNDSKVATGDFKVIVYENNFIKKVSENAVIGNSNNIKFITTGCNSESITIFDMMGRVFSLPISKIPFIDGPGVDIRTLSQKLTADILSIMYTPKLRAIMNDIDKSLFIMVTRKGSIKKLDIDDIVNAPASGILFTKLDQDDMVVSVAIAKATDDVIVYSDNKALRMNMEDVQHQKRNTKGVKAMAADVVDGLSIVNNTTESIVVVTTKGYVNKFASIALPTLQRNKVGNNVIKLSKGDSIKSILAVNDTDNIMIKTTEEPITILVSELENSSSISPGRRVLKSDVVLKVYRL